MSENSTAAGYCRRCGEELRIGLPVSVTVFVAATKAFVKEHEKRCGKNTTFFGPLRLSSDEVEGKLKE